MVAMALSAIDNNIVATAIPQVVRDLGGFSLFSWVFSSYLLTQTVTIPVYGKLADLWGRKPVLIAGTLIFLAGSALCASAWSMVSLICFRGMQGLGAGSIMATVNTLAGDPYDLEERGRVQGWLSSVWGVSAVFGPTVAVLVLVPRRFAISSGAAASTGPAGNDGRAAPVAPTRENPADRQQGTW